MNTLAHEARHHCQTKSGFFDNLVPYCSPYVSLALLIIWFFGFMAWVFCSLLWARHWISPFLGILSHSALFLCVLVYVIYYFCPTEKDARAFAKEALQNEEWLKVVKVEDIDTP